MQNWLWISPTVAGIVTAGDFRFWQIGVIRCVSTDSSPLIFPPVTFDEGYFERVVTAAVSNVSQGTCMLNTVRLVIKILLSVLSFLWFVSMPVTSFLILVKIFSWQKQTQKSHKTPKINNNNKINPNPKPQSENNLNIA